MTKPANRNELKCQVPCDIKDGLAAYKKHFDLGAVTDNDLAELNNLDINAKTVKTGVKYEIDVCKGKTKPTSNKMVPIVWECIEKKNTWKKFKAQIISDTCAANFEP